MTEEELAFDVRKIPELLVEQKIAHGFVRGTIDRKKDYGNKYLKNRKNLSITDQVFAQLEAIRTKKGFSTKGELMEYFIELDSIINPNLETVFKCKKCNETLDVPQNANLARLTHMDLSKDSHCNGSIISKQKIVKDAKDKETGTIEPKDEEIEMIEPAEMM